MSNRTIRTDKNRAAFIAALRDGLSITAAVAAAGIGRQSAYDWRRDEPDFAAEWDEAVDSGTDGLEDEAIRRAKDGSDTMLIFMLKARRPDKFAERQKVDMNATVRHEDALEELE